MLYFLLTVRPVITTVLTLLPSLPVLSFPLPYRSEFLLASNVSYLSVVCSNNKKPGLTYCYQECRPLRTSKQFRIFHFLSATRYKVSRSSLRESSVYFKQVVYIFLLNMFTILLYVLIHLHLRLAYILALLIITSLVP